MTNSTKVSNRLIHEKSPYLLQHARNPVDWWPWCEEAFQKAKSQDKPVFVSIGYSACHWCHVMEGESFEDGEVAERLNRYFISIKVDREERPDIDAFCMGACQIQNGTGGWPLSVFMTAERRPFFAGTYFPKHTRSHQIGFLELLGAIAERWNTARETLLEAGDELVSAIARAQAPASGEMGRALIDRCYREYERSYDGQYGGFGRAPKFPVPHALLFLMRYWHYTGEKKALDMVEATLDNMRRGGIYDPIGGGFCRYSTDRQWLVPHFEKMLYDNALLAYAYTEAFQATGIDDYARVARETIGYVLTEMTDDGGGFYTSQDADSEGGEGGYYLFTPEEVEAAVPGEGGYALCRALNITRDGNFEGKSIPNQIRNAQLCRWSPEDAARLYRYRRQRMKLRTDDKVLTAWNAMMIAALAKAHAVFGETAYLDAAEKCLRFLETNLTDPDGGLFIRWREGAAAGKGTLDDYAYLCWALINLYDATLDAGYAKKADSLCAKAAQLFGSGNDGGYWLAQPDSDLAVRPKESADNAVPSGNSVMGYVLIRLSKLTGDEKWRELADRQLRYIAGCAEGYPSGHAFGLVAGMAEVFPSVEIVCAKPDDKDEILRFAHKRYLPELSIIREPSGDAFWPEWVRSCVPIEGRETYYVCVDSACDLPVHTLDEVESRIVKLRT